MKIGDLVKAQTFSGEKIQRKVVDIRGSTVYLCTEQEWSKAETEKREPVSVGFNSRYVETVPNSR